MVEIKGTQEEIDMLFNYMMDNDCPFLDNTCNEMTDSENIDCEECINKNILWIVDEE